MAPGSVAVFRLGIVAIDSQPAGASRPQPWLAGGSVKALGKGGGAGLAVLRKEDLRFAARPRFCEAARAGRWRRRVVIERLAV